MKCPYGELSHGELSKNRVKHGLNDSFTVEVRVKNGLNDSFVLMTFCEQNEKASIEMCYKSSRIPSFWNGHAPELLEQATFVSNNVV